jgi:endoglucanase
MKTKYFLLSILLLIYFQASCAKEHLNPTIIPKNVSVVENHGELTVNGIKLTNVRGETVVLKGVSYGWHNWWPRFYNKSTVEHFTNQWNCNVVRAAMGVDPDGGYIQDPEFALDCMTKVIDAAIENGIYVIIDWHSHTIKTNEAIDFFEKMATKYKTYPNIIYEIFNEPERDSWQDIKTYSEEVIKAIRAIDPNNIILVGSPHWDQDVHLVADNPIEGYNNIMYTLHFYAATHKDELRKRGDYAIKKGIPLFVSECAGMDATGDGLINYEEWQKWLDWMKSNSISWVAWSIADKNETCSMIQKTASSLGDWSEADLKEWGKVIKEELTKNSE